VSDAPSQGTPAGWYEDAGSLRYWDGGQWTDQRAPVPPAAAEPLTQSAIASAVAAGVLAALFVVWLGSQLSPDHIYLPVKFVVKELPGLYGH
jgi:Protein of unknown function (DUF2510)